MTKIIYLILINLVTPKARAKHDPYVQQTGLWLVLLVAATNMPLEEAALAVGT